MSSQVTRLERVTARQRFEKLIGYARQRAADLREKVAGNPFFLKGSMGADARYAEEVVAKIDAFGPERIDTLDAARAAGVPLGKGAWCSHCQRQDWEVCVEGFSEDDFGFEEADFRICAKCIARLSSVCAGEDGKGGACGDGSRHP